MDELLLVRALLTSLGIGLMMGLERERRAGAHAGVRTFGLVAVTGTVCAILTRDGAVAWLIPAVALGLTMMMAAADLRPTDDADAPDTTTTVALVLCFLLGALLGYGHASLTVALALGATALLYFKAELHEVTHRLTRQDIVSFLQFALITFVVLPVLPDEGFGPYGQLNPYQIWLMVVLTAGLSLAGYAALRIVRTVNIVPLLGLLGGLVSSTATTLVFSRDARREPQTAHAAIAVILIANLVLLARVGVLAAATAPSALRFLAPALGLGLLFGAALPAAHWLRLARSTAPLLEVGNPVRLRHALLFGAGYAIVLVALAALRDRAGVSGVYAMAAASGLADMDAISLSTLKLFGEGHITGPQVCRAIVTALGANMVMKGFLVLVLAGRGCALRVAGNYLMVLAGLLLGLSLLGA